MELEVENRCRELMKLTLLGDATAYRELLDLIYFELTPFLRKRLPEERVEDVMQETLITIHRIRDTWDPARAFSPWLYAIADHRIKDCYRGQHRAARRDELAKELNARRQAEDSPTAQVEARADLERALAKLPDKQRNIVSLLKLKEIPLEQIATELSMSVGAVKVTAHRAYQTLKKILTEKRHAD